MSQLAFPFGVCDRQVSRSSELQDHPLRKQVRIVYVFGRTRTQYPRAQNRIIGSEAFDLQHNTAPSARLPRPSMFSCGTCTAEALLGHWTTNRIPSGFEKFFQSSMNGTFSTHTLSSFVKQAAHHRLKQASLSPYSLICERPKRRPKRTILMLQLGHGQTA